MSTAGATGPAPIAGYAGTITANPPDRPTERGAASVFLFPTGQTVETGIAAAFSAKRSRAEEINPDLPSTTRPPAPRAVDQAQAPQVADEADPDATLAFLEDFFGADKRHLVAIKKQQGILAHHFEAGDRDGQRKFITDHSAAGFDLYFSPNPINGALHKKASKNDVVEARHLWIDLDPRSGEPLGVERAAMLPLLTTNLPRTLPPPNRVIDSGRGFWGYWKLAIPQPVDGNGPLTEAVECHGRGVEQAFGDRFADGCRNIDRIARLPGTINRKTGKLARVLHEFSAEQAHPIENFPRSVGTPKEQRSPVQPLNLLGACVAVTRREPELTKIDGEWITRIFEGDVDGRYHDDRSRLAFAVACELVRAGLDDDFIGRVLMTTKCGVHVQESPGYRLARTLRRAREFAADPDLEEMNRKHAVLPIGDRTRVATFGPDDDFPGRTTVVRAQSLPDFASLHNNKRKTILIPEVDPSGNATGKFTQKQVQRGSWWINHTGRRQYDGGRKFMPKHEADVVGDVLNMFEGFPVHARKPDGGSGESGCRLFLEHGRKVICGGNDEHWEYLLKREAWIAQYRSRSEIAAAYRTEAEGSGKGFWCNHLGHLYGHHYMQINNPEHVLGKHNAHLETLLKVCADEALFVGDPRHRNALFGLITEPQLTIEPKFVGVYTASNYLNIDITTNSKHFVPASRTARRFFIPTVSEDRVGDLAYFRAIEAQLRDGGYEALLYHFLYEVDLRDFDVRRVPKTAGLAEQVEYSRRGLDGLVEKICSEGQVPCAHHQWPGFSVTNGHTNRDGFNQGFDEFIDSHRDRELRDLGALKVKRALRKNWDCMSGDDAKRRDGRDMVHGVKWPPLIELRQKFVERHGPQDWLCPDVTEWPLP